MFGDVEVRFRPSFFPFTEPSAEVDISCYILPWQGLQGVQGRLLGLRYLDAASLIQMYLRRLAIKNVSGYAFGLGVERFAMLLHRVPDLRSLFEGDLRLLEQFK